MLCQWPPLGETNQQDQRTRICRRHTTISHRLESDSHGRNCINTGKLKHFFFQTFLILYVVFFFQIDHVASQSGLVVAGYYTANENLKENSFEKAYHKIADKIAENFGAACLIVIDNSKLSLPLKSHALKVAQFSDGKFKPVDGQKIGLNPNNATDICSSLLKNKGHECLVDFDNHLDDISRDWMNHEANRLILAAAK